MLLWQSHHLLRVSGAPIYCVNCANGMSHSLLVADGAAAVATVLLITVHNLFFSATAISITETFSLLIHFVRSYFGIWVVHANFLPFVLCPASHVLRPINFVVVLKFLFFFLRLLSLFALHKRYTREKQFFCMHRKYAERTTRKKVSETNKRKRKKNAKLIQTKWITKIIINENGTAEAAKEKKIGKIEYYLFLSLSVSPSISGLLIITTEMPTINIFHYFKHAFTRSRHRAE